jgi:ferric iron reductase protein FhuF
VSRTDQTAQVSGELQSAVTARIPGAAALGLVPPPSVPLVPGTLLVEPWPLIEARFPDRTADRRVAATVWWYSVSAVLVTPALAGLVTGVGLSARLADTALAFRADGLPVAAVSTSGTDDLAAELRETLAAVVAAVAAAGRMRERPLWAIATDSIANQLLAPLPVPRYVDAAGARFTRRASCCLMVELPGGALCTSCPRRPPAERQALLEQAARWF